jgi:two-component system, LuxR family, sensor kinase FixL
MRQMLRLSPSVTSSLLVAVAAALALGIFVFDTVVPYGMAVAVLYVVVVLIAGNFLQRRGVLITAAACAVLTMLSFVLSHGGDHPTDSFVRCLMSLSAIGITTALVLKNQKANADLSAHATLLDLTHDTVFVRDMRDVIIYWNKAAEELYGWTREEAVGKPSHQLMQTVFPSVLQQINAELHRTGRWEGELVHTRRDGTQVFVTSRWSLQRDEHGEPTFVLETNNDVTERKRAEEARDKAQADLAHANRVATLGELTASIVHEVSQPLAAIVTNGDASLRLLKQDPPDLDEVRGAMEAVIRDGYRAAEVVRRMRALAKKTDAQRVTVDFNELINEVLLMVQREVLKHRVTVRTELAGALPSLHGDRIQLQQVMLNLTMNAMDAMASIKDRPRELVIRTLRDGGDHLLVAVQDSGVGIDPKDLDRLFDPFFTTKYDGMGMGLAICRSIVEAHGGRLWAVANPGAGATFQFTLSLQQPDTPQAEPEHTAAMTR